MQSALDVFEDSIKRVRALHALHGSFSKQVTTAVDLTDILRAEIVLAVSALDFFVHELTRLGMLECWSGVRPSTDSFERYALPISAINAMSTPPAAQGILDAEIRTRHSFQTFQDPDKIADAIRLFSRSALWKDVGVSIGRSAKEVKTSLKLIVNRRNTIAHEADIDPSYPGQRWPIDAAMVEDVFDELELIVRAIFSVAV